MKTKRTLTKIWTAALMCMAVLLLFIGVFRPTGVAIADWKDDYDTYLNALAGGDAKDWYLGEDYLNVAGAKSVIDGFLADENFDKESLKKDPIVIAVIDSGIGFAYKVEGSSGIPLDPLSVYQEGAIYKLHSVFDDVLLTDEEGNYIYKNVADTVTVKKKNLLGNYVATGQVIEGVTDSGNIALDLVDNTSNDHGTHCTGIVAMLIHLLGLEDYVKILPIKANTVLNYNGSEYLAGYSNSTAEPYITDAVKFAYENGADIVSMSMSATENSKEAFNFVEYSDKMVFVAAAGNTGKMEMTYPAAYEDVIGVMNYDKGTAEGLPQLHTKSTYGSWFDVAAPGTSIISSINAGGYGKLSGTSMSTPMVAFASALAQFRYRGYNNYGANIELTTKVVRTMFSHGNSKSTSGALTTKVPALRLTDVLTYNYYGDITFIDKIMGTPEGVEISAESKAEYKLGQNEKITLKGNPTPTNSRTDDELVWWYEIGGERVEIGKGWTIDFDVPNAVGMYQVKCAIVNKDGVEYAVCHKPLTFSVIYLAPSDTEIKYVEEDVENKVFKAGETYQFTLPTENLNPNLSYSVVWYVNGVEAGEGKTFDFTPEKGGEYFITVSVNGEMLESGAVVNVAESLPASSLTPGMIALIVCAATGGSAVIFVIIYVLIKHFSSGKSTVA